LFFVLFQFLSKNELAKEQILYFENESIAIQSISNNQNIELQNNQENKTKEIKPKIITEYKNTNNETPSPSSLEEPIEATRTFMMAFDEEGSTEEDNTEENDYTIQNTLTKTFCATSNQFLIENNISDNITTTIIYDNQTYKLTIDFETNNININHI
jgi:hypothetical protein